MPPAWSFAAEERIDISRDTDGACIQVCARAFACAAGLSVRDQWGVAIAASELVSNVIKFGPPGTLTLRVRPGPPAALEVEAEDNGPGFADVERAIRDGVSEGIELATLDNPSSHRSLGLGLGTIQRLMDELTIRPRTGGGSIVLARKLL